MVCIIRLSIVMMALGMFVAACASQDPIWNMVSGIANCKGIYVIPHMSFPGAGAHATKNIRNDSQHPIKVQITAENTLSKFKINSVVSAHIKNDNSEHTLQYVSKWIILQQNESILFAESASAFNTDNLSNGSTADQKSLWKIRARLVDKKQRHTIKNKCRTFNVTDRTALSFFAINMKKNKIKIMREN